MIPLGNLAFYYDEKASMFMTAIWAVIKLSLLSSKELHGGHLGGDSLAFPFVPFHFTSLRYFCQEKFLF
jgi:hypothetical protein